MTERADASALADLHAGTKDDVGLDHDVAAEPRVSSEEHGFRCDQRGPLGHRGTAQPVLHQRLGLGQTGAGVDAYQLIDRQFDHAACEPAPPRDRDNVGQVELALRVVAIETLHKIAGVPRRDRHDAAVDQPDSALFGGGVRGLDDALERAVRAQDEPSVSTGIGGAHGRDQHRRRCSPPFRQELRQCFAGQQRRVAEQHQQLLDLALWRELAVEGGEPGAHCVAGAEGRILHDALRRFDETGDSFHPRPDHDDGCRRPQRGQRGQQVRDHRSAGYRM